MIEGEDGEGGEADQEHKVLTAALQSVLAEHEREQQQGKQGDKAEGKGKKGQDEAKGKGKKDAAVAAGKKPAWQGEEAQDPGEACGASQRMVRGVGSPVVDATLAAPGVRATAAQGRKWCMPLRKRDYT